MIIKLQPDQIVLFWDGIRKSLISSNEIPERFQQDYSINRLTKLLSGMMQAWVCYNYVSENDKSVQFILVTKLINEKDHGIKVLNIEAIYGFRMVVLEDIKDVYGKLEEFAKANGCSVITADYSIPRVKEFLMHTGFEVHRTVCRKFI